MDSSTLLRRTAAGDAEVAVPANGLSLTQRRILTLLETPNRLADLPVGPTLDADRLQREALRLAQAGLVAIDTPAVANAADAAGAANDAGRFTLARARVLKMALLSIAFVPLAIAGWRFAPAPAPDPGSHARAVTKPAVSPAAAPVPTPDPPVIATRVLRSEPRTTTTPPKAPTEATGAIAPASNAESRAETGTHAVKRD